MTAVIVPPEVRVAAATSPVEVDALATQLALPRSTVDRYLRELARERVLAARGRGVFTTPVRGRHNFALTPTLADVGDALRQGLSTAVVTAWTTEWLAPYIHNVLFHHWTVLETVTYGMNGVADALAEQNIPALLNPHKADMPGLYRLFAHPLVIWANGDTLYTNRQGNLLVPEMERLLVDLFHATERRGLPLLPTDRAAVARAFVGGADFHVGHALAYARKRGVEPDFHEFLLKLDRLPEDVRKAIRLVAAKRVSGSTQLAA